MEKNLGLTENESRYLKFIYREQRENGNRITTTDLSNRFDVKPPTANGVIQGLENKDFLDHERYGGISLTEKGLDEAKNLLRKHRILEVMLVNYLDLDPERACDEAFALDFYISEELVNSICRRFEHPEVCPCGEKIFPGPECKVG